jgi:hypothetical protein
MSITTVKQALNIANPVDLPARLYQLYDATNELGFGDIVDAMRPRGPRTRTVTSSATQIHDVAAWIVDVYITAGTPLAKVYGAAPGAGEVQITYSATTGVPTFVFAGATTEYSVVEMGPLPQTIAATMARAV